MKKCCSLLFLGLFLLVVQNGLAQQEQEKSEEEKVQDVKRQQEVLGYKELETKLLEESFEQAIDPETYIVGPGDFFQIVIWGDIQKGFSLPVTPEGMLVIPNVGTLKVDKLTLKETQEQVKNAAAKFYRNALVSAYLMSMRKTRVHVTGEVLNPGTYIATPIDRLSDLINRASGLRNLADVQNIRIQHLDGQITEVDFSIFQRQGDLEQNPYVRGGDIIVVSPIDFSRPVVKVGGFVVKGTGYYPLKPGESLFSFLTHNNLLNRSQNITKVVLRRSGNAEDSIDLTTASAHETILQNGDEVILPLSPRQVFVKGAVLKPGNYQYIENLLAKDYIGMAGVTENAGSLDGTKVRHMASGETEKGAMAAVLPGDIIEVPMRGTKRFVDYLQILSTMATLALAYAAFRK